jgi:hypothetical protein
MRTNIIILTVLTNKTFYWQRVWSTYDCRPMLFSGGQHWHEGSLNRGWTVRIHTYAQNFTLQQFRYWTMLCCHATTKVGKYCIEQRGNTSDRRDYKPSGFRTTFGGGMQSRKALSRQHATQDSSISAPVPRSDVIVAEWSQYQWLLLRSPLQSRTTQGGIFVSDQTALPYMRSWNAGTVSYMLVSRFSQRWPRRVLFSGMWRRVV